MTELTEEDKNVKKIKGRFNRLVRKAQAFEFLERTLPKIIPPVVVGAAFLAISWTGFWAVAPVAVKVLGSLGFAAAFSVSPFLSKNKKSPIVTKKDAIRRLDSKLENTDETPAQTLGDKIKPDAPDVERHLWNKNIQNTWEKWGDKFTAGPIDAGVSLKAPFKLAVVAAAVTTGTLVSNDRVGDIAEAFNWEFNKISEVLAEEQTLSIKAWVNPPDGIDIQPFYLDENTKDHRNGGDLLTAHEQSTITILVLDNPANIYINDQKIDLKKTMRTGSLSDPKTTYVYEADIGTEDFEIRIDNGPNWSFEVYDDLPPSLEINNITIGGTDQGTIEIEYTTDDDIKVETGTITIRPPEEENSDSEEERVPLPSSKITPIQINPL